MSVDAAADENPLTRVLIIDDHPLLRQGLIHLFELDTALQVVGEAATYYEGVHLVRQLNPDIVVLDLNLPDTEEGMQALQALRQMSAELRIVVYTVSDQEDDVLNALRAGADGYLLKDMPPMDMLRALQDVVAGRIALSDRLAQRVALGLRHEGRPDAAAESNQLTDREREIILLIADGLSNKQIARKLDIADGTVKVHVKRILKKLGLRSRVEAAVWVVRHNLNG